MSYKRPKYCSLVLNFRENPIFHCAITKTSAFVHRQSRQPKTDKVIKVTLKDFSTIDYANHGGKSVEWLHLRQKSFLRNYCRPCSVSFD
jgi:hypothetical protein